MNILQIPFVKTVGIRKNLEGNGLELPFVNSVYNHLETIHASAQFTLAETASGKALQSIFPELEGKIIPVLRDSTIKFKNPARKDIVAFASVPEEESEKFSQQFTRKGRASILVNVEVKDKDGLVTCIGTFNWFLQRIVE